MNPRPQTPTELSTRCLAREVLLDYSLGKLSGVEMAGAAEHLGVCEPCLSALQSLDDRSDDLVFHLRLQDWESEVSPNSETALLEERLRRLARSPSRILESASASAVIPVPSQIGPYQIEEVIGEGGMGKVYKARHVHLDKVVALKVLSPERLGDPESLARFSREMKAGGQLNHPHIVQTFDAGVAEVPYLAMEWIDGIDLSHLVKQRGPLGIPEACECIRQATLGLQHAFEQGLIHRDIKPSNLMLTSAGQVKILDLGLARLAPELPFLPSHAPLTGSLTRDDVFLGTMGFVAPEQFLHSHAVDIRADLYGLGCTLFFLLTGRSPLASSDRTEPISPVAYFAAKPPDVRSFRPDVPDPLVSLLSQLLSTDPNLRPGSPVELEVVLAPFAIAANLPGLIGQPESPRPIPQPAPPFPTIRSEPRSFGPVGWILGLLLLVGLLAAGFVFFSGDRSSDEDDRPGVSPLIVSLEVEQYRPLDGNLVRLGLVGDAGIPLPATTDSFRVRAELADASYCYLIAVGADGNDILCDPATPEEKPGAKQSMLYPPDQVTRLPNPGLYAFALLASREPLPAYSAWKNRLPALRAEDDDKEGVWRSRGKKLLALRGEQGGRSSPPPALARELADSLSRIPTSEVEILAFSVR